MDDGAQPATIETLTADVLMGARFLAETLDDIWGHVTTRLPDGSGFLLKHLRIPSRGIDPDEVMTFDYDGHPMSGRQSAPWEIPLYTSIFRRRPDAASVVHVHPPVATALATAGATIHAVSHEGLEFGAGLPTFGGDIIDTPELGEGVAETMGSAVGCMLKGHGAVIVGATVRHATVSALYLERTAKQIVWASSIGRPDVLPEHIGRHITDLRDDAEPLLWRYLEWRAGRE